MNHSFNLLMSIFLAATSIACSMSVREAQAPTDPPKAEKTVFSAGQITGSFIADSTLMFLWPEKIWDENSQSLIPMTFSQRAESRKNIVRYSEEKDIYEALYIEAATALEIKYGKILLDAENIYRELQCYSLCDPEDFFCEPDNADNLFQDTWKPTEDPAELELIATCQQNEQDRRGIEEIKNQEAAQKVTPLREKAGLAAQNLLNAVGDRNFFNSLSSLEIKYGEIAGCFVDFERECLINSDKSFDILVRVHFSAGHFSNVVNDQSLGEISNISLDIENGFLTFTIPALDFENENTQYGNIHFDLELNVSGPQMTVVGDIKLENFDAGTIRIGRFSSSGELIPVEKKPTL